MNNKPSSLIDKYLVKPVQLFFNKSESVSKQQFADCILYNREGQVLLLHRQYSDDLYAGKWGFPGGHIDDTDPNPTYAAMRELLEETGLQALLEPKVVKELPDCTIHYFVGVVDNGFNDLNSLVLNANEHRAYEWMDPEKVQSYDLIADLGTYVNDLLDVQPPLQSLLEENWNTIQTAFDQDLISLEDFYKAKKQYEQAKKKEAFETIQKGFDEGLVDLQSYLHAVDLIKGGDPSHGGKLVKKQILDKKGYIQTKWVDRETGEAPVKEKKEATVPQEHWWSKFKQYNLNAYPLNIDEKDVQVNEEGDVNSHWVLKWKDPKSGAIKNAYTREFLQRNADEKWARISNVHADTIDKIKAQSTDLLKEAKASVADKDAVAIIAIISHTGLRRGNKDKFEITGNRGVSTLSVENVTVEGDIVNFAFRGKSYQDNTATLTDKIVANYIKEKQQGKKADDYLFDTNDGVIDKIFDKVGGEGLKIKDMRTYVATDVARKVLFESPEMPPPVPKDLTEAKQRKLIQDKLQHCYETVASKLNNTPVMAKNSYIHPNVISAWIGQLGVSFDIKKGEGEEQFKILSLDEIIKMYPHTPTQQETDTLEEESEEMCDEFDEPTELVS